jgi:nucleoid DNA-binding protein
MVEKKQAAKAAPKKAKAIADKQTKAQIITSISDTTGLSKKDVAGVFTALSELIGAHIQKKGSGEFVIPDTGVKIRRVERPARKARKGRNPATGEEMVIPAKKASTVVKVAALKALKTMV